jgi:hypothetical protein
VSDDDDGGSKARCASSSKWGLAGAISDKMARSAAIDSSYGVASTPSTNSSPTVRTAVAKVIEVSKPGSVV